ncbi:uncharacterized protein BX664DRAFT_338309 [Halteromyces radiatus]|uniref:uncharacterized protein n=1 Tax=Halteromyces radiatus TaxID=101107 RepID=UPI00221EC7BE|nr:uncharacterized protein BX664DRAFT_338309 [Halteromyces radiatus]KAI8085003.1 hypothetical protein BX664DRAFT_338309 [Halteromyces radiatus]
MINKEHLLPLCFALSSATFGYFAIPMIQSGLDMVDPNVQTTCQFSPVTFTHVDAVDRFLCIVVAFFQRAMDDYIGLKVTHVLLGLFGTVQAIMAVEGSRNGYSKYHIMTWFMFWGMLANVLTIALVSSLLWMPLFVLTSRSFVSRTKQPTNADSSIDDNSVPVMVSPARSTAILVSLLAGYGLPSLLMTTELVADFDSSLALQFITVWQFAPILVQLLYTGLTWIFTPLLKDDRVMPLIEEDTTTTTTLTQTTLTETTEVSSSSSTTTTKRVDVIMTEDDENNDGDVNQQRQRIRMAQSKASVEQLYLILAVTNLLIYYGSLALIKMDGVHLKDSLIMVLTKTLPSANLTPVEVAQFFSGHVLLLDLLVVTTVFSMWSLYEDGVLVFLCVLLGLIVIGPGSSLSIYCLYREQRIQKPENLKLRIKKSN